MIEIVKYKALDHATLKAIFSIKVPKWGNFILHELKLFQKDNVSWVSFPSKEYEKDGQKKYYSYANFEDVEVLKKFQDQILVSLETYLKQIEPEVKKKESQVVPQEFVPF